MQSATLDTNVFISALNFGGPCLRILDMARDGKIRLDLSNSILEEIGGVLRERFHWLEDDIEIVQRELALIANEVSPQKTLLVVPGDDDDNRIVECAATARSDYLVTSDKHLLRLGSYAGTQIVKPGEFLALGRTRVF